jgi:hypothetical protein
MDGKQGSGSLKPRCKASCQGLHGTEVMIAVSEMIPLGHRAASCMYAFHSHGALWVVIVFNFMVLVGLICTTINLQEKSGRSHEPDIPVCGRCHMAIEMTSHILYECMGLAEFRLCHLGTFFSGTK